MVIFKAAHRNRYAIFANGIWAYLIAKKPNVRVLFKTASTYYRWSKRRSFRVIGPRETKRDNTSGDSGISSSCSSKSAHAIASPLPIKSKLQNLMDELLQIERSYVGTLNHFQTGLYIPCKLSSTLFRDIHVDMVFKGFDILRKIHIQLCCDLQVAIGEENDVEAAYEVSKVFIKWVKKVFLTLIIFIVIFILITHSSYTPFRPKALPLDFFGCTSELGKQAR